MSCNGLSRTPDAHGSCLLDQSSVVNDWTLWDCIVQQGLQLGCRWLWQRIVESIQGRDTSRRTSVQPYTLPVATVISTGGQTVSTFLRGQHFNTGTNPSCATCTAMLLLYY